MAETLYTKILEALREQILSKKLKPGDQIPTDKELAAAYNVSRITTTHAVKELEKEGLIYRVSGKGTFVREEAQWRRNQKRSRLISFVVPFERQTGSAYALLGGAEAQAARGGQLLTIHNSEDSVEKERTIILDLLEHRIEGLVLFPYSCSANHDILSRLLIDRVPLVLIDRQVVGIDASFVAVDNVGSMTDVVRHLSELGHRRIAYMANTRTAMTSERDRFLGFCRGMAQSGIPLRSEYIRLADEDPAGGATAPWGDAEADRKAARRTIESLFGLPEPPTALVVVNDYSAILAEKAALEMGLSVPGDLSLTGFDDVPTASHLEVPLTTVAQPFREIGETAVRVMQKLIEDPDAPAEIRHLPYRLVVRQSTAAPGGK